MGFVQHDLLLGGSDQNKFQIFCKAFSVELNHQQIFFSICL